MSHGPVAARAGAAVLAAMAPAASAAAAPISSTAFLTCLRRDRKVIANLPFLPEGPLLVGLAVARPQFDQGAVGGARAGHVQAQAGLRAGDGAVGVDRPLLVRPAVAGPDLHLGARRGLVVEGVQALLAAPAVDGEPAGGEGPDLVAGAAAGPD